MFFLEKVKLIVDQEEKIRGVQLETIPAEEMKKMKQRGFADKVIGQLTGSKPMDVYKYRKAMGISPVYKW